MTNDRYEYPAEVELAGDGTKRLLTSRDVTMGLTCAAGIWPCIHTDDDPSRRDLRLEGGRSRKLTSDNDALMAELKLVPTEDFTSKSKDGTEVHGLLTKPAGYKAGTKSQRSLHPRRSQRAGQRWLRLSSAQFSRRMVTPSVERQLSRGAGRGRTTPKAISRRLGQS